MAGEVHMNDHLILEVVEGVGEMDKDVHFGMEGE